jgi:hypothetical protein
VFGGVGMLILYILRCKLTQALTFPILLDIRLQPFASTRI